jgi:hypothetical protein
MVFFTNILIKYYIELVSESRPEFCRSKCFSFLYVKSWKKLNLLTLKLNEKL